MDAVQGTTKEYDQTELVILMTMLANFSLIGTVGNGLVIFVFQRVREKTTAQVFMIFLALIDLFTCTITIPLTMYMEYTQFHTESDALCKIYHFFITSKIPLSAFIMVAIAVDRYFCICHPLKRAITVPRARIMIVVLILIASIFGIITSFYHSVFYVMERIDYKQILHIIGHNITQIIMNNSDTQQQIEEIKKKVAEEVIRRNMTVSWDINTSLPRNKEIVNMKSCQRSFLQLSPDSLHQYKMTYNTIYPVCLIIVIVLYLMIYRFMCLRRSKKLQQRLKMCSYVNQNGGASNGTNGLAHRDDENGFVTELSALSQSPPLNQAKQFNVDNKIIPDDDTSSRLLKGSSPKDSGRRFLSLPDYNLTKHGLSSSCSTLHTPLTSEAKSVTEAHLSPSTSCSHIPGATTEIPSVAPSPANSSSFVDPDATRKNTYTRHSQHSNKLRLYKKQESIKRYKNKKRALLKDKQRSSNHSTDYDPEHLREEHRRANARTALMLFIVNIVFVIAFGPAWLTLLGTLPHKSLLFYWYFIYNAANPFIYAFMNHIFKAYMRNIFACKRKAMIVVSS